jgi:Tfp pilus assembly protein PilN
MQMSAMSSKNVVQLMMQFISSFMSKCGCCVVSRLNSLERQDLKAKIKRQKERNMVLSRLNSELNQELQEVMEQHIALEIQMEHLRSFYS